MIVLAPTPSGPQYLPQRSASLPSLPLVAGVLPTKTRAFFNRFPQQSFLLNNIVDIKTMLLFSNLEDKQNTRFLRYVCLVYLLVIRTWLMFCSKGNVIWSQGRFSRFE
jgi:hypothetical protein